MPGSIDLVDEDLRTLADAMPQLVWITRPDGYHVYYNAKWWEFTGLTPEESAGDGWSGILHPHDKERTLARWNLALSTGETYEIEYRFRGADGEYRWFLARALPQKDAHGRIIRWFGTCTDIHDQKTARERLQTSEAWFRGLIEGSADMVGVLTLEAVYTYCSPTVRDQLGWEPEDLVGKSALEFIHPEDVAVVVDDVSSVLTLLPRRLETTLRFRNKAGDWRDCQVNLRSVRDAEGNRLLVVNSRDVTEANNLKRRMMESERLVALGRVGSVMAHEFNNVLMGIQPQAELIGRLADDARIGASVDRIQHAVTRGKSVTQQVLNFTRAEAPRLRTVDIESVVADVLNEVAGQIASDVVLIVDPDHAGLHVHADPEQIEQTLVNLCLNARDAMPRGGTIRLNIRRASSEEIATAGLPRRATGYVRISVHDDGEGIDPELTERIFEPLFTTRKRSGGSGLGLSIARQIVHAHGGSIVVHSKPGEGSSFHMLLPAAEAEPVDPATIPRNETRTVAGIRVLMVEDDDLIAEGLRAGFRSAGLVPHRVASGGEAILAATEFQPHVVVLDYALQDLPGTEVYRRLRQRWPDLPIVFLTGHADGQIVRNEVGHDQVVVCHKPVSIDELVRLLAASVHG